MKPLKFLYETLLLTLLLSCSIAAQAQSYSYDDSVATANAYPEIALQSSVNAHPLSLPSGTSQRVDIGFNFRFGTSSYSQVFINGQGILSFSDYAYVGDNLPLSYVTNSIALYPFWDSLMTQWGGNVYYETRGVAPNRVFIVAFYDIPHEWDPTQTSSFQVQLFENGKFVYKYGNTYEGGGSATIGYNINSADNKTYSYLTGDAGSGKTILWVPEGGGPPAEAFMERYEIEFVQGTNALTCKPLTFIVRSCSSEISPCTSSADQQIENTSSLPLATTLGHFSNGSSTKTLTLTGQSNETLASTTAGNAKISSSKPLSCFKGSTPTACEVNFGDTGLVFDWMSNDKTSGNEGVVTATTTSKVVKMKAVKKDDATQACTGFVPSAYPVMSLDYADPTSGTINLSLTPTDVNGAGSTSYNISKNTMTSVPFTWNSNGETFFKFSYHDAGKINLNASIAALNASGIANIISKPGSISLAQSNSEVSCVGTTMPSNTSEKFCHAGDTVSFQLRGFGPNSALALPNFGKESTIAGYTINGSLKAPVNGNGGNLTNVDKSTTAPLNVGIDVDKVYKAPASGTPYWQVNLAWDNVGILELYPQIKGNDYFSTGSIAATALTVGRFYPHELRVASSPVPSLVNRVTQSCMMPSSFSYMGEDFRVSLTLEAVSSKGVVTSNYGLEYTPQIAWNPKVKAKDINGSSTSDWSGRITQVNTSGSWVAGKMATLLTMNVNKPSSWESSKSIDIAVAPIDNQGVSMTSFNMDVNNDNVADSYKLASTNIMYGRLKLFPAQGSDVLSLPIRVEAQYHTGTGFVTNSADNCTMLSSAYLLKSGFTQNLSENEISLAFPANAGRMIAGKQTILLNKPAGGDGLYDGMFTLSYDLVAAGKQYLQSRWSGNVATQTENPQEKIVLAKNPGRKGLLLLLPN